MNKKVANIVPFWNLLKLLPKGTVVLFLKYVLNGCYCLICDFEGSTGYKDYTVKNEYQIGKICDPSTSRCDQEVPFLIFSNI